MCISSQLPWWSGGRTHPPRQRRASSLAVVGDGTAGFRRLKPRGVNIPTGTRELVDGEGVTRKDHLPCRLREAVTSPPPRRTKVLCALAGSDYSDSDEEIQRHQDLETGRPGQRDGNLADNAGDRRASSNFETSAGDGNDRDQEVEGKGWLGKFNRSVYNVVDRLSETLYDTVNGMEDGLMLPVRENE